MDDDSEGVEKRSNFGYMHLPLPSPLLPHLTWTCWNSPSHLQPQSWLLHLTSSSKISRLNALSTYAFNKEKIRYNIVLILAVV